jgi:hypothetical protein
LERFETLDAAFEAGEARGPALRRKAPQILDARRVLLLNTEGMRKAIEAGPE